MFYVVIWGINSVTPSKITFSLSNEQKKMCSRKENNPKHTIPPAFVARYSPPTLFSTFLQLRLPAFRICYILILQPRVSPLDHVASGRSRTEQGQKCVYIFVEVTRRILEYFTLPILVTLQISEQTVQHSTLFKQPDFCNTATDHWAS